MNITKLIDLLEQSKHEHYEERSGLDSCPATNSVPGKCECHADAINKEIDEAIAELKQEAVNDPI